MNPAKILAELLKLDPKAGTVILSGLGVIAAAAMVLTLEMETSKLIYVGAVILGFSFVVFILKNLSGILATLVTWVVTLGVLLLGVLFLIQALTSPAMLTPPLVSAGCFFSPLDPNCRAELQVAAAEQAEKRLEPLSEPLEEDIVVTEEPVIIVEEPSAEEQEFQPPQANKVFLQYSGDIGLAEATAIKDLTIANGWNFQPWERTSTAFGKQEIRFFNFEDAPLAFALADQINAAGILAEPLTVRDFSGAGLTAPLAQLEIWVSSN